MKGSFLLLLSSILIFGCGTATEKGSEADSLAVAPDTVAQIAATSPDASLADQDTLFNILARKGVMAGTFISVEVLTESFIDIRKGKPRRNLLAALMQTGEGVYEGIRESEYATIHSILAVFEIVDDGYQLITYADMGDGGGQNLQISSTEGESLALAEGGEAVMIHSKSSESGAGDYGFRKDEATIYILLNDKITEVLSFVIEDYQFTSDEQTATAEQTITGTMTIEDAMTKGLYDITIRTSTVRTSTEEETEEDTTSNEGGDNQTDSEMLYKWSGSLYEPG